MKYYDIILDGAGGSKPMSEDIPDKENIYGKLIKDHIEKMWGGLEMASVQYFIDTGKINGNFRLRLIALMKFYEFHLLDKTPEAARHHQSPVSDIRSDAWDAAIETIKTVCSFTALPVNRKTLLDEMKVKYLEQSSSLIDEDTHIKLNRLAEHGLKGTDAMEFAEWIGKEWALYEGESNSWHEIHRVSRPFTTSELYSLFKQREVK